MKSVAKKILLASIVLSGVVFVFTAQANAQTVTFFVDSNFDKFSRGSITATQRVEGARARYFIEDPYWNSLSASSQNTTLSRIEELSDVFDSQIYPNVTRVFGTEWNPGIDGDSKITILIMQMRNSFGGYFASINELSRTQASNSNEREMFYLPTVFLGSARQLHAFAAHEFQHLVNYNQKNRLQNVTEETWLNELMSEIAPTVSDLNTPFSESYLQDRLQTFLKAPGTPLTRWENTGNDYGLVSMFGHYLLDRFGERFYTELMQNPAKGIESINAALAALGRVQKFEDIFSDWVVSVLLNNCSVAPVNTFCYLNPGLGADNLLITFTPGTESAKVIEDTATTFAWQGNWLSYTRDIADTTSEDPVFIFTITKPTGRDFAVPYVVYPQQGLPQVYYATFSGDTAKFYVNDFGEEISRIDVMPIYQEFGTSISTATYSVRAEVSATIPADATQSVAAKDVAINIPDGSLIRAEGDTKVYITKGLYKRWVQDAAIIDMYGHLRWEDIITVSPSTLDKYQTVSLVRLANDPRVFWISLANTKVWIQTKEEFLAEGYKFDMVYEINEREFNFFPEQ